MSSVDGWFAQNGCPRKKCDAQGIPPSRKIPAAQNSSGECSGTFAVKMR